MARTHRKAFWINDEEYEMLDWLEKKTGYSAGDAIRWHIRVTYEWRQKQIKEVLEGERKDAQTIDMAQ